MQTVKVFADTRGHGHCRDPRCGAPLVWYQTIQRRRMPFDGDPVALRTTQIDGRAVEELDAAEVHWRTCPGAKDFRKKAR